MKNKKPDAVLVWKQLEEDLVPRLGLNLTERAVYAYLLRLNRLEGQRQFRFSIGWLARGVRLSHAPARHAVRSLAAKGALRLVERTRAGHVVEVFLPEEIHAAPREETVPACPARPARGANLEEMDFMQVSSRREAIHVRERGLCFYCLRPFTAHGRCLDHVVPAARGGTNSYRNLVSCCVECNGLKGETEAEDFLRGLYRLRRLTSAELEGRLRALEALAAGELRPILGPPAVVPKKPENPGNRKAWPLLPKLARRKRTRPVGVASTGVLSSPKSPNSTESQNRKPSR